MKRWVLSLALALALGTVLPVAAAPTLPRETAEQFGRLNMSYNERICPVQTYAVDFTRKLYGKSRYEGYTAEQVLTGFLLWPDEWSREPLIRVKGAALKETLHLPDYCAVSSFFDPVGGYILGPYLNAYYRGRRDAVSKDVLKTDDRLMLVMDLRQGAPLRLFPVTAASQTTWNPPAIRVDEGALPAEDRQFAAGFLVSLKAAAQTGDFAEADRLIGQLQAYQNHYAGRSVPSDSRLKAEYLYNSFPVATWMFMLNLTLGLVLFLLSVGRMMAGERRPGTGRTVYAVVAALLLASFIILTVHLALRWRVTGHVPMSNGYETMLLMAWIVMLTALLAARRFPIVVDFGFLLSGFFLLVSHINLMDPQIGHLMPVLDSPLLSLHVSVIMMSFALLAMTFACGLAGLAVGLMPRRSKEAAARQEQLTSLQQLSRLFLYPALAALGIGIFVGAIWANISWGTCWSWDPKETWALITFMVYAVAVHGESFPALRRPLGYHLYMTLAFLTILMTYFGVNYLLGGMHSYA
ncbi:MAG: cytochrome c biogenesis protein CcsA [Bacteroidales bacterium]|nr:cytochrome c biogenesis protein CcsA [Bacteroidales bacterium]